MDFLSEYWLDILTTVLGLIYIWLEYRVSIALWFVGVIMPALDVWLYWSHGLYGDAGMAVYYTLAAVYGFYVWKFKKTRKLKQSLPIIHLPRRQYLPATLFFFFAWGATYYILVTWTNSTVLCRLSACGHWRASIWNSGSSGLWSMPFAVFSIFKKAFPSRQVFMVYMLLSLLLATISGSRC